jgi:hypothetical protein
MSSHVVLRPRVIFAILICLTAVALYACAALPSDERLMNHFQRRQADFAKLGEVAHEGLSNISVDSLRRLGVVQVKTDPRFPGVVFFGVEKLRLDVIPCETEIAEKGFTYCSTEDLATVVSLDSHAKDLGTFYRRIGGSWYLYYRRLAETSCE